MLHRLERGERVVVGFGRFNVGFKDGIRLARIGVNRKEQNVGRKPAKIDDAIDDGFRRIGSFRIRRNWRIDKIGLMRNFLACNLS